MAEVVVSLPDALLDALDAEAARRSVDRSELLADAVLRGLGVPPATDQESFDSTPLVW